MLEVNYKDKLDQLQSVLTEFCKDGRVDIVLRLRVLEIIELRTMGWKMSSGAEEYYTTKIAHFQERKETPVTNASLTGASFFVDTASIKSSKTTTGKKMNSNNIFGQRSNFDEMRFQTPVKELFPDRELKERECVVVGNVKIFLLSSSTKLLKEAKAVLSDNFNKGPSFSNVKYSREDLLSLKMSPSSAQLPLMSAGVTQSCPEIICKREVCNDIHTMYLHVSPCISKFTSFFQG